MTTAIGPGRANIHGSVETPDTRDLSWTVLTRLEERLAPLFGEKWVER